MLRILLTSLAALLLAACATSGTVGTAPAMTRVSIPVAGGTANALLFQPAGSGPSPAVIIWTDGTGLRPAYAEIGQRLAAEGFVVLIPNTFHRTITLDGSAPAPALPAEQTRERAGTWRAALTEDAVQADAATYVAWLDMQARVAKGAKVGMLGLDYGSSHAFVAARAMPARIGAVAALYPSGTATPRPNSPHLFVSQSSAAYLVVLARNDDVREPGDKDDYRKAFTQAGRDWSLEVAAADHGFAVADETAFDPAAAHNALAATAALFRRILK